MMGFTAMQAYNILKGNLENPGQLAGGIRDATGFSDVQRPVRGDLNYGSLFHRMTGSPDGHNARSLRYEDGIYHGLRDQVQRTSASLVGTMATTGATLGTIALGGTAVMRAANSASGFVGSGVARGVTTALASGGMRAGVSLLNLPASGLARLAPSLFGGAPQALSTIASSIPRLAAGVGKLGGVAGAFAAHALPLMAVGKAVSWAGKSAVENLATQRQIEDWMDQTGYQYTMGGEASNIALGKGFDVETQADIGKFVREVLGEKEWMRQSDFNEIFRGIQDSELDFNVTSAKEFKAKFEKVTEVLTDIARTFETTLEGAVRFLGEMQRSGFYNTTDQASALFRNSTLARSAGKTTEEMISVGMTGAEMARQVGLPRKTGSELVTTTYHRIATAHMYMDSAKEKREYQEGVQDVGGAEEAALQFTSLSLNAIKEDRIVRLALFGLFDEDGSLDRTKLTAFHSGEITLDGMLKEAQLSDPQAIERYLGDLDTYLSQLNGEDVFKVVSSYISSVTEGLGFEDSVLTLKSFLGMEDTIMATVFARMLGVEQHTPSEHKLLVQELQRLQFGEEGRSRSIGGWFERAIKNPLAQLGQKIDFSGVQQSIGEFVETFRNERILQIEKVDISRKDLTLESYFERGLILDNALKVAEELPQLSDLREAHEKLEFDAQLLGTKGLGKLVDGKGNLGENVLRISQQLIGHIGHDIDPHYELEQKLAAGDIRGIIDTIEDPTIKRLKENLDQVKADVMKVGKIGQDDLTLYDLSQDVKAAGEAYFANPGFETYGAYNKAIDSWNISANPDQQIETMAIIRLEEFVYPDGENLDRGELKSAAEISTLAWHVEEKLKQAEFYVERVRKIDGVDEVELSKLESALVEVSKNPFSSDKWVAFNQALTDFSDSTGGSIQFAPVTDELLYTKHVAGKMEEYSPNKMGMLLDVEKMINVMESKEADLRSDGSVEAADEMKEFIEALKELVNTLREARVGSTKFNEALEEAENIRKKAVAETLSTPTFDTMFKYKEEHSLYAKKREEMETAKLIGLEIPVEDERKLKAYSAALSSGDQEEINRTKRDLEEVNLLTVGGVAKVLIKELEEDEGNRSVDKVVALTRMLGLSSDPSLAEVKALVESKEAVSFRIGVDEGTVAALTRAVEEPLASITAINLKRSTDIVAGIQAARDGASMGFEDDHNPLIDFDPAEIGESYGLSPEAAQQLREIRINPKLWGEFEFALGRGRLDDLFSSEFETYGPYAQLFGELTGRGVVHGGRVVMGEDGKVYTEEEYIGHSVPLSLSWRTREEEREFLSQIKSEELPEDFFGKILDTYSAEGELPERGTLLRDLKLAALGGAKAITSWAEQTGGDIAETLYSIGAIAYKKMGEAKAAQDKGELGEWILANVNQVKDSSIEKLKDSTLEYLKSMGLIGDDDMEAARDALDNGTFGEWLEKNVSELNKLGELKAAIENGQEAVSEWAGGIDIKGFKADPVGFLHSMGVIASSKLEEAREAFSADGFSQWLSENAELTAEWVKGFDIEELKSGVLKQFIADGLIDESEIDEARTALYDGNFNSWFIEKTKKAGLEKLEELKGAVGKGAEGVAKWVQQTGGDIAETLYSIGAITYNKIGEAKAAQEEGELEGWILANVELAADSEDIGYLGVLSTIKGIGEEHKINPFKSGIGELAFHRESGEVIDDFVNSLGLSRREKTMVSKILMNEKNPLAALTAEFGEEKAVKITEQYKEEKIDEKILEAWYKDSASDAAVQALAPHIDDSLATIAKEKATKLFEEISFDSIELDLNQLAHELKDKSKKDSISAAIGAFEDLELTKEEEEILTNFLKNPTKYGGNWLQKLPWGKPVNAAQNLVSDLLNVGEGGATRMTTIMSRLGQIVEHSPHFDGAFKMLETDKPVMDHVRQAFQDIFKLENVSEKVIGDVEFMEIFEGRFRASSREEKTLLDTQFKLWESQTSLSEKDTKNAKDLYTAMVSSMAVEQKDETIGSIEDALTSVKIINAQSKDAQIQLTRGNAFRHLRQMGDLFLDVASIHYGYSEDDLKELRISLGAAKTFDPTIKEGRELFFDDPLIRMYANLGDHQAASNIEKGKELRELLETDWDVDSVKSFLSEKLEVSNELIEEYFSTKDDIDENIGLVFRHLSDNAMITPGQQAIAKNLEESAYRQRLLNFLLKGSEINERLEETIKNLEAYLATLNTKK